MSVNPSARSNASQTNSGAKQMTVSLPNRTVVVSSAGSAAPARRAGRIPTVPARAVMVRKRRRVCANVIEASPKSMRHDLSWRFELIQDAPIVCSRRSSPRTIERITLLRSRRRYNGDSGGLRPIAATDRLGSPSGRSGRAMASGAIALHRPCPELVGALRAERERPFTLNGLLFDDLVSAGEDRQRDGEAERLGGLEIDDQLEGRWLLDRQIGRLGALQDPSGINADLVTDGYVVNSIADQAADRNEWRMRIYCRNGMALRQRDDLLASARDEPIGVDDEPDGMQPVEGREGGVDFGFGAGFQDRKLYLLHEGCFLRVSD